jgi:hypothetical protein
MPSWPYIDAKSNLAIATVASMLQSGEGNLCKSKAVHEDSGPAGRPKKFILYWGFERKPSETKL